MCKAMGKTYLVLINALTAILGLVVVGVSIYALAEYADITAVLSKSATWVALAAGAVIFFFSIFGCNAARKQNRCQLFVYIVVMFAIAAAQVIAGIVIANYAGELETKNGVINNLTPAVQDFVTCSYVKCCGGSGSCTNPSWEGKDFCKVFPKSLTDGCESESAADFNQSLVQWLHDNEKKLSLAAIIVGAVELLAVFFATILMCSSKKTKEERDQEKALMAQKKNQAQAGQLTYGADAVRYA